MGNKIWYKQTGKQTNRKAGYRVAPQLKMVKEKKFGNKESLSGG